MVIWVTRSLAAHHYQRTYGRTTNMAGRPSLVAVKNGRSRELVRRETIADLLARDRVYKQPRVMRRALDAAVKRFSTASDSRLVLALTTDIAASRAVPIRLRTSGALPLRLA
jgi:hypothetical protein